MEYIYKNISLDIYNDITSQLTISVKQGDTAKGVRVALTDHGKVFKIPDNCYAVFSGRKGNGVYLSDGCTIQNNTIIVNFTDAVVSVPTQIDSEITVFSANGEKLTSPSFMIFVYKTIEEEYASDVVESNSFTVLNDLISETAAVIANANDAIGTINEAVEKTNDATEDAKSATMEAKNSVNYIKKTSDGRLEILDADLNVIDTVDVCYMDNDTIYRYEDGVLKVVGIKELNANETFRMWVGTNEEYQQLSEKDENTFYWITDDATFDEVVQHINDLNDAFTAHKNALKIGAFVVGKANNANNANLFGNNLPNAYRGNGTFFDYPYETNVDLDNINYEYHKVVGGDTANMPPNETSGFLDVSVSSAFGEARILQKFTATYTCKEYVRARSEQGIWGDWVCVNQILPESPSPSIQLPSAGYYYIEFNVWSDVYDYDETYSLGLVYWNGSSYKRFPQLFTGGSTASYHIAIKKTGHFECYFYLDGSQTEDNNNHRFLVKKL